MENNKNYKTCGCTHGNLRKEKGLTLIVVVIIIIVLLILAGITIVQLTGKGLFRKEKLAENIEFSYDKERIVSDKMQILIKIKDEENGINEIEYPDGDIVHCNGKNQVAIDYMIELEKEYIFKIISNDGYEKEVSIYEEYSSLVEKIEEIEASGYYKVSFIGKTSDNLENIGEIVNYNLHMITYDGNLTLDGITNVEGATIEEEIIETEENTTSQKVYEFGDKDTDVAKRSTEEDDTVLDATNMVVLKVNGDLTIDKNVTLTACKSDEGYGGPKGMFIYCTGTLTNKGTISMTARGARAEGQNVYIFQNSDGSYEYVPAVGAAGGERQIADNTANKGNNGKNGIDRQTGGGGSGATRDYSRRLCLFW